MKKITLLLVLMLLSLCMQTIIAQDKEPVAYQIKNLEQKKEDVTRVERELLKKEVETINQQLKEGKITKEKADNLKIEAAERHAKNIENRIAIFDNQIALLQRNGSVGLNSDIDRLEISIGGEDPDGDRLFGIKYSSGKQEEIEYDKRTYDDFFIAFGLNNAIIEGQSLNDSPYRLGSSRFFEIGWGLGTRVFKNSNFLRLHYGASFQFNGLKPEGNQYFVVDGDQTGLEDFEFNLDKSKFRMDNLVFPVHLEFGSSKVKETERSIRYSIHNQFRLGIGGYAGFNLNTRQKLKYELDGDNVKDKFKRNYNTNNFIYGLSAYMGFDSVLLYVKYDLNPIFKDAVIEQKNFSLGLRLDLN